MRLQPPHTKRTKFTAQQAKSFILNHKVLGYKKNFKFRDFLFEKLNDPIELKKFYIAHLITLFPREWQQCVYLTLYLMINKEEI